MSAADVSPDQCRSSERVTQGVRVLVEPSYEPAHSQTDEGRFVFSYRVRISNESERRVQLIDRRWVVIDADGDVEVIEGEGVVCRQPAIEPGEAFAYSSWCPLPTRWGTMEGSFGFRSNPGDDFRATIGRFYLVAPEAMVIPE